MQEVTPENICGGKVAGLKDIQYRLVHNLKTWTVLEACFLHQCELH